MAQATLSQEDLKALEQARQRLYQLSNNIASLKGDVLRSSPLPQWSVGTCSLTLSRVYHQC
jgi:mediator of RNA polymerase II transcription subunit 8